MAKHRRFVKLDGANMVIVDITITRESEDWSDLPNPPDGMIELVADPLASSGRLGCHTRNGDGTFTPPQRAQQLQA